MPHGLRPKRPFGRLLTLAVTLACLLPATALATVDAGHSSPLAPSLATLADPAVAAKPPAQQARILGLPPSGPGSLLRHGDRLVVQVRFDHGAIASRGAVAEAGATVLNDSRRYQLATVAVVPADLQSLAAVPTVAAVTPERTPVLYVAGCEGGSVISEGVTQLRVDEAREAFPLRGKGITVGVLSDTYNAATEAATGGPIATRAQQDIAGNDLPGPASTCSDQQLPVRVLQEGPANEATDEGRAMLQIVHDLAPHASLAFATAFDGELGFAQNIERLAAPVSEGGAGADVIVDDVSYFEEPFFQDGPVAAAINKVTSNGITYLTAAGNDNLFDAGGNEIASWEAPAYRDAGSCPAEVASLPLIFNPSHCMDFNPGGGTDTTFGIKVDPGETLIVDLQWNEPWNGVSDDLDAFLLAESGELLAGSIEDNVAETQTPAELVGWENTSSTPETLQLVVNRRLGALNPRLKFILMEDGSGPGETEYPETSGGDVVGPTIYGHAGAASAISVAAIPFNSTTEPEEFSSRGPVTHYFGPVEGNLPAASLLTPEELTKPDVTASDCVATTFFAFKVGGVWRFCGTSAAAPHAAAVAALLRQGDANATALQVRESLVETATPIGAFPETAVGTGLVDARAAIESLPEFTATPDGPSSVVPPIEEPVPPPPSASNPPPPPSPPAQVAPQTSFLKHPPKVVRTRSRFARVVFRFGSDQAGATFLCKVDGGAFRPCGSRITHRFAVGRHVVRVKAVGSTGLADATPAIFRFRVERVS
ncbi:MAG TPA: S8 family serine peptidase [Solirubrobacterales bacterium]|nr:S8 family serine peptidase [Solirubrobacterales bacterium]